MRELRITKEEIDESYSVNLLPFLWANEYTSRDVKSRHDCPLTGDIIFIINPSRQPRKETQTKDKEVK